MSIFSQLLSSIITLALVASPASAVLGASPTATSTQNSNSSSNTGAIIAAGVAGGAALLAGSQLLTSIFNPLKPFGGRVATVVPCSGGMFHITIIPAGLSPVAFIWMPPPATITKLNGPPLVPNQKILGLYDIPFVCFIGVGPFSSPIPLYGMRMSLIGTSIPGVSSLSI